MTSFAAIYTKNCKLRKESPDFIGIYEDLDSIWAQIEARQDMQKALDENKLCMAMPRQLYSGAIPDYFNDGEAEGGEPIYFYDPITDAARVEIINLLDKQTMDRALVMHYGGKCGFVTWKLQRLEKRFKLKTWEALAASYK